MIIRFHDMARMSDKEDKDTEGNDKLDDMWITSGLALTRTRKIRTRRITDVINEQNLDSAVTRTHICFSLAIGDIPDRVAAAGGPWDSSPSSSWAT